MSEVRPLAVALICDQSAIGDEFLFRARAAIATMADVEGYAVAEILESSGATCPDRTIVDGLIEVAARVGARAILVFGELDEEVRAEITARSCLTVLPADACMLCSQVADGSGSVWTGRIGFELRNGYGWRVAAIEVVVHLDRLDLWHAERILAVIDRDRFGAWLAHPDRAYPIDDLVWSMHRENVYLTIKDSIPYMVPIASIQLLTSIIGPE